MLGTDLPCQMESNLPYGHYYADSEHILFHPGVVMTHGADSILYGYNLNNIRLQPHYSKETLVKSSFAGKANFDRSARETMIAAKIPDFLQK